MAESQKTPSLVPDYDDRVETLNLSNRSTNALKLAGIRDIEQFLNINERDVCGIKNIGAKSAEEILQCQKRLLGYGLQKQNALSALEQPVYELNISVRAANVLAKNGVNTIDKLVNMRDEDIEQLKKIGKKTVKEIMYCKRALSALPVNNAAPETRIDIRKHRLLKLQNAYQMIPGHRRDRAVQDYLSAVSGIEASLIIKESGNFLPSLHSVSDIVSVFEEATNNTSNTQKVLFLLGIFAFDVRASLDRAFGALLSEESFGRFLNILEKRIAGQVLQEIADSLGLTRERVRQLECKGIKLLNEHLMPLCVDIIAFIDMENNFEKIITHEELRRCIGDAKYFDLFLYAMKTNGPWDAYQYHKRFHVFCRRDLYDRIDALSGYMNALPAIIDRDQKDAALESLGVQLELPLKIIMMEFVNAYKPAGRVYYRGKLSLARMYDYVLEKYYPEGIKLFDDAIIESFKKQVVDVFGEIDVSENNHAIYSRITSVSVLCDRGTYIHPCFVTIDAGLIDEIASHILISPKGGLSFGELFEDFRQKLALRSNINNKYFLHGALELRLKDRFLFTRDAIVKKTKT